MAEQPGLELWLWKLRDQTGSDPEPIKSGTFRIAAGELERLDIGQAPKNTGLVIDAASAEVLMIVCQYESPLRLTVRCLPAVRRLVLDPEWPGPIDSLVLELAGESAAPVHVDRSISKRLVIRGGACRTDWPNELEELTLDSARLECEQQWFARGLVLHGTVQLSHTPPRVHETHLVGSVVLRSGPRVLGRVINHDRPEDPIALTLTEGAVVEVAAPLAAGSRFDLDGAQLDLRGEFDSLTVSGQGRLWVRGTLRRSAIESQTPARRIVLGIDVDSEVWNARGSVLLDARPGSICHGLAETPLQLLGVQVADDSELDNVNMFGLSALSDLRQLAGAERLSPWMPRRWLSFRPAREAADGMDMTPAEKAHFWSRLSDMLRESHARGAVQADVRYLAKRARRHELSWGREKSLLTIYSAVGYGERILLPLILLVLAALLVTQVLVWPPGGGVAWQDFFRVLVSPLAFFRFVKAVQPEGLGQEILLVVYRVLGLGLLVLAFLAARRVVRAD